MSDIPQWAIKRASVVVGPTGTDVITNVARYIAIHEAPPVDPDEAVVLAVVRAYMGTTDETEFGPFDIRCTDMQAALAAYREHKA